MRRRWGRVWLASLVLPAAAVLVPSTEAGAAQSPLGAVESGLACAASAAKGPTYTDVNAQAGDGRITVGENASGNITVFKYPNPSLYNQVDYTTSGADADGSAIGELPNMGSFAGLRLTTDASGMPSTSVVWFKAPGIDAPGSGWTVSQAYQSTNTPVIVTTYHSATLGLTVTDTDLATAAPLLESSAPAAYVRDFSVSRALGSPVTSAQLVYYEHFSVIGSQLPYAPVEDSCADPLDVTQLGTFNGADQAIVQSWRGLDVSSLTPDQEAFAFGLDGGLDSYQVGIDHTGGGSVPLPPTDGYDQLAAAPYVLGDSSSAVGQVTGTLLSEPLDLSSSPAQARVIIGAGNTPAAALASLQAERTSTFGAEDANVTSYWDQWLSTAPMPQVPAGFSCPTSISCASGSRIVAVAKRALIGIRLAIDPDSGAIVASADTQEPYGEDWTRDGAYINEALDQAGYHDIVTKHELFEVSVQSTLTHPDPGVPPGNWPQAVYGNGVAGGPILWEIDETGFATWSLYQHSTYLSGSADTSYLRQVFPAIEAAADWLSLCQDPIEGLECPASEDDNLTPSESLDGAGPALAGIRAAIDAADTLGVGGVELALWKARDASLTAAINRLYIPSAGVFGMGAESELANLTGGLLANGSPAVPTSGTDYSVGGYLVWPVALDPYSTPDMTSETIHALSGALNSLEQGSSGGYEGKGIVAACKALPTLDVSPAQRSFLRSVIQVAVAMLAQSSTASTRGFTTNTGMFGESWKVYGSGASAHVEPENDMPHIWEGSLFYLAATCAF